MRDAQGKAEEYTYHSGPAVNSKRQQLFNSISPIIWSASPGSWDTREGFFYTSANIEVYDSMLRWWWVEVASSKTPCWCSRSSCLLTIDHKYLDTIVSQISEQRLSQACLLKFLVANSSAIVIFAVSRWNQPMLLGKLMLKAFSVSASVSLQIGWFVMIWWIAVT